MDIVGFLPRSRSGSRYVLFMCDYATRYPEVVPLQNIDEGTVAEDMLKIFVRVGISCELLTVQGANFQSQLLKELSTFCMSMPFLPAHTTSKQMGWWSAFIKPSRTCLLGQDATISPVCVPAGAPGVDRVFSFSTPVWARHEGTPGCAHQNVLLYIHLMQERMEAMGSCVQQNLKTSATRQKVLYDWNPRECPFQPGHQVLVLQN